MDDVLSKLQSSSDNYKFQTFDSYARRYGLANMAYEGGPDVAGTNNQTSKKAAMLDHQPPRMTRRGQRSGE